jgi:hypothetical protein
MLEEEFVSYEQALSLEKLGFKCKDYLTWYQKEGKNNLHKI